MSIADSIARSRLKMAALAECAPSRVIAVADSASDAMLGDRLRGAAAGLLGGRMAATGVQLYELQAPEGAVHLYGQPFDGYYPLPGEHHAWVPGAVPMPAEWRDGFAGGSWNAPDKAYTGWLKGQGFSTDILRADWAWKIGAGVAKRSWLMQLRPLAGGTHIALAATGCMAQTAPRVGFGLLRKIAGQVGAAIAAQPPAQIADAPFPQPTSFGDAFEAVMRGQHLPVLPEADLSGRDLGPAIHQLLGARTGAGLFVHPVPPKKEQNARMHVLPPDARGVPIVALLDLTVMGSAKDAVVFTPTHCFIKQEEGARIWFAWSEVRAVRPVEPADDAVVVQLATRGELAIPCGHQHTASLHQLAAQLAAIP